MTLSSADFSAIWLTLKLASLTTVILLIIGTPIALWLSRTRSWWRGPVGAIVALPLVLPPTVIGFYLLLALGPHGFIGQFTQALGLGTLTFSFAGLVIGSVLYSMPFVVQPLQNAFAAIGTRQRHLELITVGHDDSRSFWPLEVVNQCLGGRVVLAFVEDHRVLFDWVVQFRRNDPG